MYTNHINYKDYTKLKKYIANIANRNIEDYDLKALAAHIQSLYYNGDLPFFQYDDLMSDVQELL